MEKPSMRECERIYDRVEKAIENGLTDEIIATQHEQINAIGQWLRDPNASKQQCLMAWFLLTSRPEHPDD